MREHSARAITEREGPVSDDPSAPPDPASVLELEARKAHIELHSIDSRTDPIYDDERALAIRRLLHRNHVDPRGGSEDERS
jgi:hypothetical protein